MPDLPTRLDLFAIGRDYIRAHAAKIDPAQVDIVGSDVNIVVASSSLMAAECMNQLAQGTADLTLEGSWNEKLDRYAWDKYTTSRKGASSAVCEIEFRRSSLTAGAGTVPTGTKVATLTGIEFASFTTASFSATSTSARCFVRSLQAGSKTRAGVGAIQRIQLPSSLFDPSLSVTNTEPASHGEDREEDPAFKARIRDYWGTARRGILEAIALGARSVPGIDSATALEVITPDAYPGRVVQLFVADSTGNTSRALTQTVIDALLDYRAAGIAVIVSGSIPQMVDVVLNLVFQAGVSSDLLTERIRAVLVGTINSLPVNSTLTRGVLQTQLTRFAAEGLIATESTLVAPTGDLVPTPGSTIRTTLDRVTVL